MPQRLGNTGGIFLDDCILEKNSQDLEKSIQEMWKIYISKRQRNHLELQVSEVNVLRKKRSGSHRKKPF